VGTDGMAARPGLTPDEDEELRRLHWFETQGMELSDDRRRLKAWIRQRDRREHIRVPRQLERVFEPTDPDGVSAASHSDAEPSSDEPA